MIRRKIGPYLAGKKFIQKILANPVDLSEFKERPTPRLITGLILMGLSYLIGWPAVAALSALAVWFKEPLIAVIGCPTTYALSYVVFIIGAWLSRAPHYMGTLARYTTQSFLRKLIS
jgi:CHASE2 domain-containing sensor protein